MKKQYAILNIIAILLLFATATITAQVNKPIHVIPFKYEMNKIIVPVTVNGSKVLRGVLDTGMPGGVFIMDSEVGKSLNLEYSATNVMLRGAGSGTASASMASGAKVSMGDVQLENQRVIVMNDSGPLHGSGFSTVIGASIFNKFVVRIDIEKETILLYEPKTFDPKDAGESLDMTIVATKPYIKGLIDLEGKKNIPVTLVLDTGAGSALMLSEDLKNNIAAPSKSVEGIFGRGVGGDVLGKMARTGKLSIGKSEMSDVVTLFRDTRVANADGLIGMDILDRYLVTFDYSKERMYIKPNKDFGKPFEFSMIGIALRPGKDGKLGVVDVFKNSAAEAVGIQKGDKIISIDKKPLTLVGYFDFVESNQSDGRKILIGYERNGKMFEKTLILKRLV